MHLRAIPLGIAVTRKQSSELPLHSLRGALGHDEAYPSASISLGFSEQTKGPQTAPHTLYPLDPPPSLLTFFGCSLLALHLSLYCGTQCTQY